MDGKIPIKQDYMNDKFPSFIYRLYTRKKLDDWHNKIRNNDLDGMDYHLQIIDAIKKHPVKDKEVVVVGAGSMFDEAVSLYFGAKHVTSIEYTKIKSKISEITAMTPKQYDKNPKQFDVGISISNFEHDGLGRYGDPINPDADLEIMQKMKKIIKKDGILFFGVPLGKDLIMWNSARIYGRLRLPLMLKGWEVIDTVGFNKSDLDKETEGINFKQPVFVLRNK
jgi:hypothetical protein